MLGTVERATFVDAQDELEEAQRQVAALTALAEVSLALARTTRRDELHRVATTGVRRVLAAAGGARGGAARLVVVDGERLAPQGDRPLDAFERRLVDAVSDHFAAALRAADRLARATDEHLVRDLFVALAEGRGPVAESRARAAGHDLDRPHVVALLEPLGDDAARWPELAPRVQARLRRALGAGVLCAVDDAALRALIPAESPSDLARVDAALDAIAREEHLAAGRSEPRAGVAAGARGLDEATCAAQVARATAPGGGARGYGELGVYRYLAQLPAGHAPDERHAQAIATLAAYDARRRTELLGTLERHLGDRGALAATARALYIHTNTLRQRLDRIEALTGLDLAREDLLSLELALKLARLHGTA